jgi:hypothetical protein
MRIVRSIAVAAVASGLVLSASGLGRGDQRSGGAGSSSSQSGQSGIGAPPPSQIQVPPIIPSTDKDLGPIDPSKMEAAQAKSRNIERQKKIVADTEKLLALATELKGDVDKSDKNMLSLDVIKKADEIEKLAHSVKEKMKG